MLSNKFAPIDIAQYINGFTLNIQNREIFVSHRHVKTALDEISFRILPTNVLPYIPCTISPGKSSYRDDYLEHPLDAINEYKQYGAKKLIAELKHMGSRAVIIVFRDEEKALEYTNQENKVVIYSRAGKAFFDKKENDIISQRILNDFNKIDYFNQFDTGFVIIDAEILPWNAKGEGLLTNQYLPVLDSSLALNNKIKENLTPNLVRPDMVFQVGRTLENIQKYKKQLENYCWDTNIETIRIAPFHLLGHEGKTYFDQTHEWHLNHFLPLTEVDDLFIKTPYAVIDLENYDSIQKAVDVWEKWTNKGFEGVVLKTEHFIEVTDEGDLILPMMKVRGKDYLRIIYGIDYDSPKMLTRLRNRSVSKKRALHYKEFSLGIEALKRFTKGEDFVRWHECVLATLCLTTETVDHRL